MQNANEQTCHLIKFLSCLLFRLFVVFYFVSCQTQSLRLYEFTMQTSKLVSFKKLFCLAFCFVFCFMFVLSFVESFVLGLVTDCGCTSSQCKQANSGCSCILQWKWWQISLIWKFDSNYHKLLEWNFKPRVWIALFWLIFRSEF